MANSVLTPSHPRATDLGSIDGLVRELRATYDSGATRPYAYRIEQLDRLDRMLTEREGEILDALASDLGKPAIEGYTAEIALCRNELKYLRKHLRGLMKEAKVSTPIFLAPAKSTTVFEPLGVVLVIAPWNYPFQLAIAPLLGALAAGNVALVKPSEVAPATSALLARLLPQYVDPRAVKVVEGGVAETTRLLDQRWDHIFYTGNGTVGRIVMAAAAKHLTPVTLELGGKSPVYVDAEANLEVAARRIASGKYYNCGQTCVAPDYALVHRSVRDAFVSHLNAVIEEFYGKDPKASADYARIVNERHHGRLVRLLEGSGTVAAGGVHDVSDRYIAPTVLVDVTPDAPIMADEIFGPILPVLTVDSADEAITFINARPKPLALYVFSERSSVGDAFVERTSAGGMCVNHVVLHLTVEDLPFGGVGESGMGAYHGRASFETFSHRKSIFRKPTFLDPKLAYPPYTAQKQSIVRKVL